MQRHCWGMILISLCVATRPALAETYGPFGDLYEPPPTHGYIEGFGNWGVNFGRTDYVPDGAAGQSEHPFAKGFGVGGKIGVMVVSDLLSVFADYRYGQTRTREGEIPGVLFNAKGKLDFHEITAGLRIENRLGPGRIYGEMGLGVLLPFHTTREFDYAPELAAVGIMGTATEKANYTIGYGGHGEVGYQCGSRLYIGGAIRIATFQSNNNGEDTELTNFVTDFMARPPVAVTTDIHHSADGPVTPTTYAVSDVRINLQIGLRF